MIALAFSWNLSPKIFFAFRKQARDLVKIFVLFRKECGFLDLKATFLQELKTVCQGLVLHTSCRCKSVSPSRECIYNWHVSFCLPGVFPSFSSPLSHPVSAHCSSLLFYFLVSILCLLPALCLSLCFPPSVYLSLSLPMCLPLCFPCLPLCLCVSLCVCFPLASSRFVSSS